jgi:cell division ATPase FtsA
MPGIADYARSALQLSARVAKPEGYGGVVDQIDSPAFATATGLMLIDLASQAHVPAHAHQQDSGSGKVGGTISSIAGKVTGILGKLRS